MSHHVQYRDIHKNSVYPQGDMWIACLDKDIYECKEFHTREMAIKYVEDYMKPVPLSEGGMNGFLCFILVVILFFSMGVFFVVRDYMEQRKYMKNWNN